MEALKARFLKHTLRTSKSKVERTVNMNIIRKETTSEGKEELKADVVPAVLAAESLDETVHTKPGWFGEEVMMVELENTLSFFLSHTPFPNAALWNTAEGIFICEISMYVLSNG